MTQPNPTTETYNELMTRAVQALTAAARLTRTIGAGTASEHTEPADFAEFLTLAVAATAANIGSTEGLLAGRPGSWEADHVRNMLISTVGEDETYLLQNRTEPLTIAVNVEEILDDLGYYALQDEAEAELARREAAVGWNGNDGPTDEQEAFLDRIDALRTQLDELLDQDRARYGEAFERNVLAAAAELFPDLTVEINVIVELHWQPEPGQPAQWYGPEFQLWERARQATPLPGCGIPLKDYPVGQSIAETERAAGRNLLDRL